MAGRGRRWLFAALPLVLLLGGGELALRIAGWPRPTAGLEFAHNEVYWATDPSLRLEPFPHKETGDSFRVSTDANGLRAPLHSVEKPKGVFRIMTLGCSTTFGWGVDDEQTYPARLEALLRENERNVEVINGGQPGHSSFQGLWMWDRTLAAYKPDLVIFGYIVQDARKVAYSDRSQALLQHNADFLKSHLLYNSRLYMGARALIDSWRTRAKEDAGPEGHWRVPPDEYAENIRTYHRKVTESGGKFMLFGFPLEREGYTGEHRAIQHAAARVLDVPAYDPQEEIARRTASELLYFPQDRGHANPAGCEAIAQGMAQHLIANRLVPPGGA
jgi:lysophospholipase L1-like esterase